MANNVFANGREISCKSGQGKSICAFPDVCMTPPENPATPPGVPVPYPNTAFASDTTDGSRTVKISGKEIMLKNKSYFKKSTGDEAGCAAKKGVITSSHRGKVYFIAWSDDVKIEGENAVRHLDMTTHNHASPMANDAAPMVYVDTMAAGPGTPEHHIKCAIQHCDKQEYDIRRTRKGRNMPRRARCSALGSKKHKCVSDYLEGKQSEGIHSEVPHPKGSVPGLANNRRPDIVVYPSGGKPISQPCDVYDAKFPCSEETKRRKRRKLHRVLESRAVPGAQYVQPTSKEMTDYKQIAGAGGKTKVLTPKDCENQKCP